MRKIPKLPMITAIAFLSIISIFTISCSKTTPNPSNIAPTSTTQISANSAQQSTIETPTPTPTDVPLINKSDAASVITAKELGLDSIGGSYFYWSPNARYAIFTGALKDTKGKFTINVYLFEAEKRKAVKILDGFYDKIIYMTEPHWSEDESLVTVPFYELESVEHPVYIYDITNRKLNKLAINGTSPSISPDKNKVAYINNSNALCVYNLSSRTSVTVTSNVIGFCPIWFSDNARILFKKQIDISSSKIQTEATKAEICMVDTKYSKVVSSLGFESLSGGLTWIVQDRLVWDIRDGEMNSYATLDTVNRKYTVLGEYNEVSYQVNKNSTVFIFYDNNDDTRRGFHTIDTNKNVLGKYTAESEEYAITSLALLSDNNLLYMSRKMQQSGESSSTNQKSTIMLSYMNAQKYVPLFTMDGDYISIRSKGGSKIALVSQEADKMIIIDTTKIDKQ